MAKKNIIVGARGSTLSRIQAQEVIKALTKWHQNYAFIFKAITTTGDTIRGALPQDKGLFVKEIEEALLAGDIDLAVHSAKDMPTVLARGLKLAAVTKRADPHDALISKKNLPLHELPPRAVIGTSSLRRKAQLLCARGDVVVVPLRGNIDTRLKKLNAGTMDAIICASCALKRINAHKKISQKLPLKTFLPSPGQGALGIEVRRGDRFIASLVKKINHSQSYVRIQAEREFLAYLGGGCRLPVGAHAYSSGDTVRLSGFVADTEAKSVIRVTGTQSLRYARRLAKQLARQAIHKGARHLLVTL